MQFNVSYCQKQDNKTENKVPKVRSDAKKLLYDIAGLVIALQD